MLDVQSARRVQDRVDKDVRLTLLQQVQHLLQGEESGWWVGGAGGGGGHEMWTRL